MSHHNPLLGGGWHFRWLPLDSHGRDGWEVQVIIVGKIIDAFSFQEQLASMQRLLDAKDIFFCVDVAWFCSFPLIVWSWVLINVFCKICKIVETSQHLPRGGVWKPKGGCLVAPPYHASPAQDRRIESLEMAASAKVGRLDVHWCHRITPALKVLQHQRPIKHTWNQPDDAKSVGYMMYMWYCSMCRIH